MDTPETKDPRKPVMCFGAEATGKTQELVDRADGHVQLEKDVSETDKYDRLLRYVWLVHPDGTRMLNEELVKGGYAQSSTYPPDVKYQELFMAAQCEARELGRGIWGACGSFGVEATPVPTVATLLEVVAQSTGGGSSYSGGDMDCKDFASQAEAHAYFNARGGSASNNVDRLDGSDHDGIVFESLS
ncbi:thermonuclease family protein [Nitrolancea hollandica]|uniref:thermonuclease family protein n=1 Tax=Nitrolancea hollandica TaxID=1206749 RepID=UPI001930C9E5|nr:thermonuclease family protein [Nitrolancea hollandica]